MKIAVFLSTHPIKAKLRTKSIPVYRGGDTGFASER